MNRVLLIFLLLFVISSGWAQNGCLSKQILFRSDHEKIETLLSRISTETGCRFSFSPQMLPLSKELVVPEGTRSVREVLQLIVGPEGFTFKETSDQVIIYPVRPKRVTLSGHVQDSTTGEFLIGANVFIPEIASGVSTNVYGFYSIALPPGEYSLQCTHLGYRTFKGRVSLNNSQSTEIFLSARITTLEELTISAVNENPQKVSGVDHLTAAQLKTMPALGGETDVIKSLQLLPGVKTLGEGSSGFYVRGGDLDQNLILLDEAPVYNPSHMLGFFSAFNPDAIKDVRLYSGGIPAQYGGRLSSLLDIRMKDGNAKQWTYSGGLGLISSRFTAEGPLVKDKTSLILALRRTYADLLLALLDNPELTDTRLSFYDINLKLTSKLNKNNSLYLSTYAGDDTFSERDQFNIGWGNRMATLRWNHLFSDRLFSNTSLIYSKFNYALGIPAKPTSHTSVEDYNIKTDFTFFANDRHAVSFGGNAIAHRFSPGTLDQSAMEYALYLADELQAGRTTIEYGLRYSALQNTKPAAHFGGGIEPRIALKTSFGRGMVTLSYNRMRQYVHRLSNYSGSFASPEIWLPASDVIKPQSADQLAIGYTGPATSALTFSADAYYKAMNNVIDYKDHATLDLNPDIEDEILTGTGRAFGLELQLKKVKGRSTGWVSYTISRTERRIPGINNDQYYRARFDRPHAVTIVFAHQVNERWSVSANWVFASGEAITVPTGSYQYNDRTVPIYSSRNAARMPSYHRLDLSATWERNRSHRNFSGSWTFGVYNAYYRKNAFTLNYNRTVDQWGNVIDGTLPPDNGLFKTHKATTKTYLFGIVPSVTYNFKFR